MVWSRTRQAAQVLAEQLASSHSDQLSDVPPTADLYIIAVSDHAIGVVAEELASHISPNTLVVHTSGATPTSVLAPHFDRCGVFYPLQSFSPGRTVDFSQVPLCLHAEQQADYELLEQLAEKLSEKNYRVSDNQRLQLHLAAVFVNNFTNYLQFISQSIVEEHQLPGALLLPLLQETISKLQELSPADAQTGPAIRDDQATIKRHLALLENHPHWQELYRKLSDSIRKDLS